jgi:Ca2+-binding RTX toxin-like protein
MKTKISRAFLRISRAFLRIKFRIIKIFVIGIVTALAFNLASPRFLENSSTIRANGDLNVNWGVPDGQPIFMVTNMMPGQTEQRSVSVINKASTARTIAVRGVKTAETDNLSTVLDFVISEGAIDLYTGTLSQFFSESAGPDGIPLSTLGPSLSTTYTFRITFDESANNEFQGKSVVFDLIIGIAIHVPAECKNIKFSGDPIFGTEGNDNIHGTNGNDLIFGFEGNDKIDASNGDDCIIGGPGNDKLDGSNGNDVILGNEGNDTLDGSNGNDKMYGGEGNDVFDGSNGDDYMIGGFGNDRFDASNGNDYVEGNEGDDNMLGGNGNDTLLGGLDKDSANGNLGRDTCEAETKISCEL